MNGDGLTIAETERLRLRTWAEGDDLLMDRHCNTPAVLRWVGPLQTLDYTRNLIGWMKTLQAEHGHCYWALERKADGEFLGFCGIKIANDPNSPLQGEYEMGWRLREDAWGQGYGAEAARATIAFAFNHLGAKRVIAVTIPQNENSWRLMERLGLRRMRRYDYWEEVPGIGRVDAIVYMLTRAQWEKQAC